MADVITLYHHTVRLCACNGNRMLAYISEIGNDFTDQLGNLQLRLCLLKQVFRKPHQYLKFIQLAQYIMIVYYLRQVGLDQQCITLSCMLMVVS